MGSTEEVTKQRYEVLPYAVTPLLHYADEDMILSVSPLYQRVETLDEALECVRDLKVCVTHDPEIILEVLLEFGVDLETARKARNRAMYGLRYDEQ